jgi:hypothetical protein
MFLTNTTKITNNHKCSSTFGTILPCTLLLYAHCLVQVFLYIDICICPSPAIHVESPPHLRFRIKSGILHNTTRRDAVLWSSCVGYGVRICWQRRIFQHRVLWCYGEYQTLYGTLDGVDFQHGWPDLDKYIYLCIEIPIQHVPNKHYQNNKQS